jgi:large subunit ribosomal protein L3
MKRKVDNPCLGRSMTANIKLMGKKRGMTQRFNVKGALVPCTVIHVEPNVITQIKRQESDGYNALQLGCGRLQARDERTLKRRVSNQLLGHFKKAEVEPRRFLSETRLSNLDEYSVGQELGLNLFEGIEFLDVIGISQGKGFQGVMKRHNFAGGPAAHGSGFHRHGGSTGMRTTPGRCLPGTKKPGQMGADKVTVQNLRVVEMNEEKGLLVVEGAVPGARGSLVWVTAAKKKKGKRG